MIAKIASPAIAEAFARAGDSGRQALEVVLGIAAYTPSTFVNIVTEAALDPPFAAFAERPTSAA